jgi:hypothetical protein
MSMFRGENKNVKTDKTDDGHCVITKAHPGFDQSERQFLFQPFVT